MVLGNHRERGSEMDDNLRRCQELFADLLRAAYDEGKPIDRELAKGAAECGAYLLDRIKRPDAHPRSP
jgi:hypothetical protein